MNYFDCIASIVPADLAVKQSAQDTWNSIAKPLGSLGILEDNIIQICAAKGTIRPDISKRAVATFCADNGVVAEQVTQSGSEVTTIVAANLCTGDTSVCKMAGSCGCDVYPVDVGMITPVDHPKMLQHAVAKGTQNLRVSHAMTREQAISALEVGINLARDLTAQGYTLLAAGEMGIGNTTTSSAVASVMLQKPVELMTGPGAGLSASGVQHKIAVIEEAISRHQPDPKDPLDVLMKVGGFDIAAMAGFYLGAASCHNVCLLDGFISAVAAILAVSICPACSDYLLASHVSAEPAGHLLLDALGKPPVITAGMRLGEGTGAMAAMPLLDMSLAVFSTMATFEDVKIEAYVAL